MRSAFAAGTAAGGARGCNGPNPDRWAGAQSARTYWLEPLLAKLSLIELTSLIGQHAQRHFLGKRRKASLADMTQAWAQYCPPYIPLPHPSPRNTPWLQRNSGFEQHLLPELRWRIQALLAR